MDTLYVKAKSKKEINERLKKGETVYGQNFSMFGGAGEYNLADTQDGTLIKVYQKIIQGNPYAKSYGVMKNGRVS